MQYIAMKFIIVHQIQCTCRREYTQQQPIALIINLIRRPIVVKQAREQYECVPKFLWLAIRLNLCSFFVSCYLIAGVANYTEKCL